MGISARRWLSWALLMLAAVILVCQGSIVQQAQRAQQAAEMRWELAIAGSLNGMFDCRFTGPIQDHVDWAESSAWFSPQFLQLLGYDADAQIMDDSMSAFMALVHEDDRCALDHRLADAVRNEKQVQVEIRAQHLDGTYHWYLLSAAGTHNHVKRISGSILDITYPKMRQLEPTSLPPPSQQSWQLRRGAHVARVIYK